MNPSALAEIIGQEMADEYGLPADLAVAVERPKSREHGDYATNVALTLAKSLGKNPREIAETLVRRLRSINGIANADVAGPGFVNIVPPLPPVRPKIRAFRTSKIGRAHV